MTGRVEKVAALVTRAGAHGLEVVVFDHPLAGTQLPAGTLEPGESPAAGVLREGWEETGVPGLRVVAELSSFAEAEPGCGHGRLTVDCVIDGSPFTRGNYAVVLDRKEHALLVEVMDKQGWIEASAFCDDVVRHIYQLTSDVAMPDEWWVITPDGDGLCWHCRWVPVDSDIGLIDRQASWLVDTARGLVPLGEQGERFELPEHPRKNATTYVVFSALSDVGRRFIVSWVEPDVAVDDAAVRRAMVAGVSDDGEVLLVSGNGRSMWNFPGGGREPGETIEETARRELLEEACAEAADLTLIGYQHVLHLDDDNKVIDEELQARFAGRIELLPWEPAYEMVARQLVPADGVRAQMAHWWQPDMLDRLLAAAVAAW